MTEHRIRIIQPRLRDGDIAGNLAMTLKTIRASAGQADLLVFPETCISGFPRPDNVAQLAEPLDGPSATALREAARQAGVAVAIGLAEADQGRRFNAGLLIDADGQVLLHYRKTMLYDSDQGVFEAGERWPTCEWRGLRLGMLICFDIEFAAPARALGAQGVDLIVLMDGMMHPHGHIHRHAVPVRAMDNQCYIAMANLVGPGDSYAFSGGSQFADPFGQTLARIAGDAEGLLDVRLDPLAPGRARAQYRG